MRGEIAEESTPAADNLGEPRFASVLIMSNTDTVILADDYTQARAAAHAFVDELQATLKDDGIELPSLPEIALRIRKALANDAMDIDRITQLIGSDPALAARLLKTANCALFRRGDNPVKDLRTAVTRLGYTMVRNVSLSLAAQQVFVGYAAKPIRAYLKQIWEHSVQVAMLGYLLARYTDAVECDEAFLAGLLHEIGKLYILIRAKDHPELLRNDAAFKGILADWQPRMGRAITKAWGFSEELTDAIGGHESCSLICKSPASLTEILAVANFLAVRIGISKSDEVIADLPSFGSLSLDTQTLAWILAVSADEVQVLQEALGA
jgi:HD-like signal output (HDOD) protein